MNALPKPVQALTAGLLVAAAVPVAFNQFRLWGEANNVQARAAVSQRVADAAVATGDDELAVRAYTEASSLTPERLDLRKALGQAIARQVVNHPEALTTQNAVRLHKVLAESVDVGDQSELVALAIGRIHLFRGQHDAAQKTFDDVSKANPKNGMALLFLGDLQLKDDELDNAQATLRKALEADPTLTLARFALGQVYLQKQAFDDARPLLEQAVQEQPRNGQAQLALGRVYAGTKKWADAEKALERALTLDPNLTAAHGPLGDAYLNLGKVEPAVGSYRTAWEKNRDLESFRKIGRIQVQLGNVEAAAQIFNQIKDLTPEDPEPHLILGLAAQATKRPDLAARSWQQCVELAHGHDKLAFLEKKCGEYLAGLTAGGGATNGAGGKAPAAGKHGKTKPAAAQP